MPIEGKYRPGAVAAGTLQEEEFARFCRTMAIGTVDEARDLHRRLDFLDRLERVREFGKACGRMALEDPEAAVANLMSYACVSCMPVLLHYEGIVDEGLADRLEEIKFRQG